MGSASGKLTRVCQLVLFSVLGEVYLLSLCLIAVLVWGMFILWVVVVLVVSQFCFVLFCQINLCFEFVQIYRWNGECCVLVLFDSVAVLSMDVLKGGVRSWIFMHSCFSCRLCCSKRVGVARVFPIPGCFMFSTNKSRSCFDFIKFRWAHCVSCRHWINAGVLWVFQGFHSLFAIE